MNLLSVAIFIGALLLHAAFGIGSGGRGYTTGLSEPWILLIANALAGFVAALAILRQAASITWTSAQEYHQRLDVAIKRSVPLLIGLPAVPVRPGADPIKSVRARFSSIYFWLFIFGSGFSLIFYDGLAYSRPGIAILIQQSVFGSVILALVPAYLSIWALSYFLVGFLFPFYPKTKARGVNK